MRRERAFLEQPAPVIAGGGRERVEILRVEASRKGTVLVLANGWNTWYRWVNQKHLAMNIIHEG